MDTNLMSGAYPIVNMSSAAVQGFGDNIGSYLPLLVLAVIFVITISLVNSLTGSVSAFTGSRSNDYIELRRIETKIEKVNQIKKDLEEEIEEMDKSPKFKDGLFRPKNIM